MISPTLDEFKDLAGDGHLVPVYREVPADLETPLSAFLKLRQPGPSFLLESVEKGEAVGRFSFLGTGPSPLMRLERDRITYSANGSGQVTEPVGERDALAWLKHLMGRYRAVQVPGLPRFWGGAVGYLGYDAVRRFERLPEGPPDDLGLPEACFVLSRHAVLFDHVRQRMFVVVAVPTGDDPEADYRAAVAELDSVHEKLARPLPYQRPQPPAEPQDAEEGFNRSRQDFQDAVVQAKEHIAAGDIFQVVLSQRYSRRTWADGITLYRALRILNPSPYMFYLDLGDFQMIGSSPEMMVKLEDGEAHVRPIAGTRPRGRTAEEDESLEADLLADPKELAEHVMLVDLGRNDLGRVCDYGTVQVSRFKEVERYSHVMHIVSNVRGRLRRGSDGFELGRACFPAGTVSGAPKIRAMEIIDELEPTRRGPYAGAVGYHSFFGNVDTCICIRTMVKVGDRVYVQAGAGIVADSDPATEYQETLNKLAAMRRAIELAEGELLT